MSVKQDVRAKGAELVAVGKRFVGVKEIPGPQHHPNVVQWFADSGHPQITDDETAWCAAYLGGMLKAVGLPNMAEFDRPRALLARSYLKWGDPVNPFDVQPGDLGIWPRGKAWQGHVGIVVKKRGNVVTLLSGNKSNRVGIDPFDAYDALGFRRISPWMIKGSSADIVQRIIRAILAFLRSLVGKPRK